MDKFLILPFPYIKLHAYCLMPNHFHFLIYVRDFEELKNSEQFQPFKSLSEENLQGLMEKKISKSFANLFSSYAQSFNKLYKRRGSLFIPNMKIKMAGDNNGICKLVHYIHANPVHHGFIKNMELWKFSSYNSYLSGTDKILSTEEIIDIFGSLDYFIEYHKQPVSLKIDWDT